MLIALWTLVGLMAAAFAYVLFICRKMLASEFKAWRTTRLSEEDISSACEGALIAELSDIEFTGARK